MVKTGFLQRDRSSSEHQWACELFIYAGAASAADADGLHAITIVVDCLLVLLTCC